MQFDYSGLAPQQQGTGQMVGPAMPHAIYLDPEQVADHRRHQEATRAQELLAQAATMDAQAAVIRSRPPLPGWARAGVGTMAFVTGYALADAVATGTFWAPASRAALGYAGHRWGRR
ncbi:MAG: hypothetical protein HY722_00405 [Planctomycetes bacterium]|nr:hypothetical protein [Planctomycetota bacterium]